MSYRNKEKQNEYQRKWIAERRAKFFKDKFCVQCGSDNNLELDHIDPSTKEHHAIWSWSQSRRDAELAKCQVLCRPCHIKKSIAEGPKAVHGKTSTYNNHKCRCDECVKAKSVQNKKRYS